MGFTHRGKKMGLLDEDEDDFKDKIALSSDDEGVEGRDKGKLTEEMVNRMNFGGGESDQENDEPKQKKTRKEVFAEIMEKSKAFDHARKLQKDLNVQLGEELDAEFEDVVMKLDFQKNQAPELSKYENVKKAEIKGKEFDNVYASLMTDYNQRKELNRPVKQELTEKEQAAKKKEELEKLYSEQQKNDENPADAK